MEGKKSVLGYHGGAQCPGPRKSNQSQKPANVEGEKGLFNRKDNRELRLVRWGGHKFCLHSRTREGNAKEVVENAWLRGQTMRNPFRNRQNREKVKRIR